MLGKKFQIWSDLVSLRLGRDKDIMHFHIMHFPEQAEKDIRFSCFTVLASTFCQHIMKKSNSGRICHAISVNMGDKHRRLPVRKEGPCSRMALGPSVPGRVRPVQPCLAALAPHSPSEMLFIYLFI